MHNYRELNVWKKAIQLTVGVYGIVAKLPVSERYELSSQLRRASVSIASNIAEGAGRNNDAEFMHFLGVANGSSYELSTQLIIANSLQMVEKKDTESILMEVEEVQKMLFGLIEKLKKEKKK